MQKRRNWYEQLEEKKAFLIKHSTIPIVYYSRYFPFGYEQIKKYEHIIDWHELRYNNTIRWTISMIDKFREALDKRDRWGGERPCFSS